MYIYLIFLFLAKKRFKLISYLPPCKIDKCVSETSNNNGLLKLVQVYMAYRLPPVNCVCVCPVAYEKLNSLLVYEHQHCHISTLLPEFSLDSKLMQQFCSLSSLDVAPQMLRQLRQPAGKLKICLVLSLWNPSTFGPCHNVFVIWRVLDPIVHCLVPAVELRWPSQAHSQGYPPLPAGVE